VPPPDVFIQAFAAFIEPQGTEVKIKFLIFRGICYNKPSHDGGVSFGLQLL
jgi:hypothetical protein